MSQYRALVVDFGGVLTTSITTSLAQFCASTGGQSGATEGRPP